MKLLITVVEMLLLSVLCLSCAPTGPTIMVAYPASEDSTFEEVKENLEMAILGEGLKISKTLELDVMLKRTGTDLGYPDGVYHRAESLEFCSALLAHRMAAADPVNLAACPFAILVFSTAQAPEKVYLAFRRPKLEGAAAGEVEEAMSALLETIVQNTLE